MYQFWRYAARRVVSSSNGVANYKYSSRAKQVNGYGDTIYAVSSGQGKCGVAVVRISGPQCYSMLIEMGRFKTLPLIAREALLRTIVSPKDRIPLDRGLLLWFPGPNSFTGEDCCEFQVHGGPAVISAMLQALNTFPNTRHAEPGEFTKRAFLNGKLDLTEVEGLGDVIHAETELQRQQAFHQMMGSISGMYSSWRRQIIKCTAAVEAFIDFSEEENIEDDVIEQVYSQLKNLAQELKSHISDGRKGERLRNGVHVAILGAPNVGKSSLMNYLTQRPAAIVSPHAGTTRDVLETSLNLNGYPIVLCDTAGLRTSQDEIEIEGVQRAVQRSHTADVLVFMLDVASLTSAINVENCTAEELGEAIAQDFSISTKEQLQKELVDLRQPTIFLVNKIDVLNKNPPPDLNRIQLRGETKPCIMVSVAEEDKLDTFVDVLTAEVKKLCANPNLENPSYTQARHRNHISNCLQHLLKAKNLLDHDTVIAAESLRQACDEIGQLGGRITSDDVLDVIFKDFCIGK